MHNNIEQPISAFDSIKILDLKNIPGLNGESNKALSTPYTPIENEKPNHGGTIGNTKSIENDISVSIVSDDDPPCFCDTLSMLEGGSKMLGQGRTSDMGNKRWTIDAYPRSTKKITPPIK